MMQILMIALSIFGIGMLTMRIHACQESQSKQSGGTELGSFMRLKLGHAKGILEGLATEDFEQIANDSQALRFSQPANRERCRLQLDPSVRCRSVHLQISDHHVPR